MEVLPRALCSLDAVRTNLPQMGQNAPHSGVSCWLFTNYATARRPERRLRRRARLWMHDACRSSPPAGALSARSGPAPAPGQGRRRGRGTVPARDERSPLGSRTMGQVPFPPRNQGEIRMPARVFPEKAPHCGRVSCAFAAGVPDRGVRAVVKSRGESSRGLTARGSWPVVHARPLGTGRTLARHEAAEPYGGYGVLSPRLGSPLCSIRPLLGERTEHATNSALLSRGREKRTRVDGMHIARGPLKRRVAGVARPDRGILRVPEVHRATGSRGHCA